jgi:hypothetical protein
VEELTASVPWDAPEAMPILNWSLARSVELAKTFTSTGIFISVEAKQSPADGAPFATSNVIVAEGRKREKGTFYFSCVTVECALFSSKK